MYTSSIRSCTQGVYILVLCFNNNAAKIVSNVLNLAHYVYINVYKVGGPPPLRKKHVYIDVNIDFHINTKLNTAIKPGFSSVYIGVYIRKRRCIHVCIHVNIGPRVFLAMWPYFVHINVYKVQRSPQAMWPYFVNIVCSQRCTHEVIA